MIDGSLKKIFKKKTVEVTMSKDCDILKMATRGSYDIISLSLNGNLARLESMSVILDFQFLFPTTSLW